MSGKLLRRPRAPKQAKLLHEDTNLSKQPEDYQLDQLRPLTDQRLPDYSGRLSPTTSVVPSLISPPPPSEATHKKGYSHEYQEIEGSVEHHVERRGVAFITRDDKKYILDSVYREKSMTAGSRRTERCSYYDQRTSSGPATSQSYKNRGPDPLPCRLPRQNPEIFHNYADLTDDARYIRPPDFTLDDFVIHLSEMQHLPLKRVTEAVYSKHNYKKITKLLMKKLHSPNTEVKTVMLTPESQNVPSSEQRIPQRQLLIEMAAMIKQHVRDLMHTDVRSIIKPLPKYSPNYHPGSAPHTEIILYEDSTQERKSHTTKQKVETELPAHDAVFHTPRSVFFQGSARSGSPFNAAEDAAVISPAELAILDSLISGGCTLSLKAHFISVVPDLSPLLNTVTYVNLSFNDFTELPAEILDMAQLEVLKMRNNPMTTITNDIEKLTNLRILVLSFCLVTCLPKGGLKELNMEGNQMPALPRGALKLKNLQKLNVKNNFMHPLFWKDHMRNEPQQLVELSALAIYVYELHRNLGHYPEIVRKLLAGHSKCDSCQGPLFGPGLRIIRPVPKMFGINYLPILFLACSPMCKTEFMKNTTTLSESLYGDDTEE